jgi:hypothetical protein
VSVVFPECLSRHQLFKNNRIFGFSLVVYRSCSNPAGQILLTCTPWWWQLHMFSISSVHDVSNPDSPNKILQTRTHEPKHMNLLFYLAASSLRVPLPASVSSATRNNPKRAKLSICQNVNKQCFQRDNTVYNAASCYVTQAIQWLPSNSISSRIACATSTKQSITTSTCAGWTAMLRTSCITYTRKQWNFPNQSRSPVRGGPRTD